MAAEDRLRFGTGGCCGRFELGDHAPAPHDRVALASVLDTVEQVGESP
jgi:hypothetical protein